MPSNDLNEAIRADVAAGLTDHQIAEKNGASLKAVRHRRLRMGIKGNRKKSRLQVEFPGLHDAVRQGFAAGMTDREIADRYGNGVTVDQVLQIRCRRLNLRCDEAETVSRRVRATKAYRASLGERVRPSEATPEQLQALADLAVQCPGFMAKVAQILCRRYDYADVDEVISFLWLTAFDLVRGYDPARGTALGAFMRGFLLRRGSRFLARETQRRARYVTFGEGDDGVSLVYYVPDWREEADRRYDLRAGTMANARHFGR